MATEPEIAPAFEVIPAIDLAEGRVVRLVQGRFEAVSDFGGDPLATADRFWSAGARTLHVVDLDAARTGRRSALHRDLIARLAERRPPGGRLQVGGGFRDGGAIAEAAALGVDRVVVGTLAFREPAAFDELLREHAPRLCVSADTLAGSVRVAGWAEDSGVDVGDALRDLSARGALAFLVTAIDRDGTLAGPDVPLMTRLRSATPGLLLASGGIGRLEDLRAVRASGADGVVVGRALLAGAFSLDEALDAVAT